MKQNRMLTGILLAVLVGLWVAGSVSASEGAMTLFRLQDLKSNTKYGPFSFSDGKPVKVPSGDFSIKLSGDRSFVLSAADSGEKFGVYELVPGRIIDVGGTLYTITDIVRPVVADSRDLEKSVWAGTTFGLSMGLVDNTKYDWDINGLKGGSADMQRTTAELGISKGVVNARLGLILASEWDNSIGGDGTAFENATLKDGSGWFAGLGVKIPVLREGAWRGDVFGDVSYSSEDISLKYGGWQSGTAVSTSVTNGATNVTSTTNYEYKNFDEDATLTETLVTVGAALNYSSRIWFGYAGVKLVAWSDASLDATIVNGGSHYSLSFERSDPVMAYGGIGFVIKGVKCYLEAQGGGENSLRIGLLKEL